MSAGPTVIWQVSACGEFPYHSMLYCVRRSNGYMASIYVPRVSVRHSSTRRNIYCFWLADFVTVKRKRCQWLHVWALSRHHPTSHVDDSVHCQGSAVQPGSSLLSGGTSHLVQFIMILQEFWSSTILFHFVVTLCRGSRPGRTYQRRISAFRGNWCHRLADSDYWNLIL